METILTYSYQFPTIDWIKNNEICPDHFVDQIRTLESVGFPRITDPERIVNGGNERRHEQGADGP